MTAPAARSKDDVRRRVLARRSARPQEERVRASVATTSALLGWRPLVSAATVATYLSFGDEPSTDALVGTLLTRGARVLAPRIRPGRLLEWAWCGLDEPPVRGRFGIPEPSGPEVPDALAHVDVVLVPALAVDSSGTRLGRGAGYYDRALGSAPAGVPLVALVYDDELLSDGALAAEPHDVPITHVATASGVHRLG